MQPIEISAVITDGESVLFASVEGPSGPELRLPRYPFGEGIDTIEEALAAHLLRDLGITVVEQEFLETVYERAQSGATVVLNNLQIVTAWEGAPLHSADAQALVGRSAADLSGTALSPEELQIVAGALGLGQISTLDVAGERTGRVLLLLGAEEPLELATALQAELSGSALVSIAALSAQAPTYGTRADRAALKLAVLNCAALAMNYSAAGLDSVVVGPAAAAAFLSELGGLLPEREIFAISLLAPPQAGAGKNASPGGWQLPDFGGADLLVPGLHADLRGLSVGEAAVTLLEQLEAAGSSKSVLVLREIEPDRQG